MIKLIVFDVGGVIINYRESMYVDYLSKKFKIPGRKIAHVLFPLVEMSEYGRLDVRSLERIVADKLNIEVSDLDWIREYKRLAKVNGKVTKLVSRLSRRYRIALLTNVNASRYDEAYSMYFKKMPMKRIRSFASCYLKMRKPDLRMYRHVLRKMRVKGVETLFIDNQIENVVAAKEVGINSIEFVNYRQLVKDLKKLNIM